ncbi:MAG: glycosyltransferase family 4 protein [Candidatus Binatia bacterium]
MRILWVGHNLAYPPVRGVLQRNYNLLREAAKSCEVHVLAFDQPDTRPSTVSPADCVRALERFCATVQWLPLPRGIHKRDRYWLALRGMGHADPFDIQWMESHEMAGTMKEILGRASFDVVHFDTLGLAQYRPLVRNRATVLNHHNIESSMTRRRSHSGDNLFVREYFKRESKRLSTVEKYWCPRFAMNLVVSHDEEQILKSAVSGIRTAVVPNGVDTEYFRQRPDPGGAILLFCGGLDWYPNNEAMSYFFKEIWPKLSQQIRDVQMYVVGRKPPKWLLRLRSEDPRVHVPGFVVDVRPYFEKATAYICPIRQGGGTRLKVLDALAMGVPLIGTSFSCSGLSVQSGKDVLLAESPEDFSYQIQHVIENPALRRDLAVAGRELVERAYAWGVIGTQLIGAYEKASRVSSLMAANI